MKTLAYHKVTGFELGGTWVPPGRFVRQIDALLEAGFRFVGEGAFLGSLDGAGPGATRPGAAGGPDRDLLLTFDDGYRMLLDRAIPALEARRIPALVFLVTAYMGRENGWELDLPGRRFRHMGWDEARDLAGRGFAFGSHTRTHADLTRLAPEAAREEVARSKDEIEERLGVPARTFSYPFGRVNDAARREVERAGYEAAFTLYPRRGTAPGDRWELRREGVWVIDTVATIRAKLSGGIPFLLEDAKGRAINAAAAITPLVTGARRGRGAARRRPSPGR